MRPAVREAYVANRESHLEAQIVEYAAVEDEPYMKPDQALLAHLRRTDVDPKTGGEASIEDQDVNCMVIWARPPREAIDLILELQSDLADLVGNDLFPIPAEHLHCSVLEVSHRHSVAHLRRVAAEVSTDRLQNMLDEASSLDPKPALECPQLNFDRSGVALNFVPVADEPYTYHHLRSQLQTRLLKSGIGVDTCYTAATAHIAISRVVGTESLATTDGAQRLVDGIGKINRNLRLRYWAEPTDRGSTFRWRVGEEKSLELQLGYLKFGRDRKEALLVGRVDGAVNTVDYS